MAGLLAFLIFIGSFFHNWNADGSTDARELLGDELVPQETTTDSFASFCETETFQATCANDEVIFITHARYGRMRISRCVKLDYGHLGCVADVIELADSRCSGRRRCEIRIPDSEFAKFKPCPDDLKPYLEIGYKCVKVQTSTDFCIYPKETPVPSPQHGFLASLVTELTGCGGLTTPWSIVVSSGQAIQLTLLDFGVIRSKRASSRPAYPHCETYAILREPQLPVTGDILSLRNVTVCGGLVRQSIVHVTVANRLEIGLIRNEHLIYGPYYVFEYKAIGCPDLESNQNAWYLRSGNSVTIKCNFTREVYQLKCEDNVWVGEAWNCSSFVHSVIVEPMPNSSVVISYGLSVLIILVIALAIGAFVLFAGLVFFKRRSSGGFCMRSMDAAYEETSHLHSSRSFGDKQHVNARSLVRNLSGSVLVQTDKLPWQMASDRRYDEDGGSSSGSGGNGRVVHVAVGCRPFMQAARLSDRPSQPRSSPLLPAGSDRVFPPPPQYCHLKRKLPCGCDAYFQQSNDVTSGNHDGKDGESCSTASSSVHPPPAIYLVLDPQKHNGHRTQLSSTNSGFGGFEGGAHDCPRGMVIDDASKSMPRVVLETDESRSRQSFIELSTVIPELVSDCRHSGLKHDVTNSSSVESECDVFD